MGLSTMPACQPCQKCASVPEGHPWSVCASLDISWMFQMSQMSWRPRRCATVPDGSKSTRLYLWLRFVCNDDFSVFYSLMWWPIGCVCHHLLFKVLFYSLFYSLDRLDHYGRQYVKSLFGIFIIVHSWIIQYLDKMKIGFVSSWSIFV